VEKKKIEMKKNKIYPDPHVDVWPGDYRKSEIILKSVMRNKVIIKNMTSENMMCID
jgi:hypothetical protein